MNTQVAKTGAAAAIAGLKRGIQNTRQALPASSTEPILRMGTDGIWVYGQENTEVEEESTWAINPLSIQHGFVCWTNKAKGEGKNELLGEVYAPMTSEPIDMASLPKHINEKTGEPWPWKAATTVQLKCISGEDEGVAVIYKPSSIGGANAMQAILDALEEQLNAGSDQIVPIVEMSNDHYQHKQYGKTYVPMFSIVSWADMDGTTDEEAEAPKAVEKPVEKPKKKKAKQPEPEVEDAVVEDVTDEEEAAEAAPATEGRTRRRRRAS